MKKSYPYKMWSRLSVTSAALLFGASAAQAQITAVNFGGDYNGSTALGLTYEVTGKTDLTGSTWSDTGIDAEAEVTALDDEFEAVTATTPIDEDNKFLRLEITN